VVGLGDVNENRTGYGQGIGLEFGEGAPSGLAISEPIPAVRRLTSSREFAFFSFAFHNFAAFLRTQFRLVSKDIVTHRSERKCVAIKDFVGDLSFRRRARRLSEFGLRLEQEHKASSEMESAKKESNLTRGRACIS
jgi:hypothetical protein